MADEAAEPQVEALAGQAQLAALAGQACVGLGALLALAGFGAPWVSSLGGWLHAGGVELLRWLLADPMNGVRTWGAWNASQLVTLPAVASVLLLAAMLGAVVIAVPSVVPVQRRSLLGFFRQGLPLCQLVVASWLGWGVMSVLVPLLVEGASDVGIGLPVMLAGAGLAAAGSLGALLAGVSHTRAVAEPSAGYAAAA